MVKSLMRNKKVLGIIITIISSIISVLSIVFISMSFEVYSDEWGTDISIDSDYLVLLLISISLLIAGIYLIYAYNKTFNPKVIYSCVFTGSLLLGLYPLGRFFRALAKGSSYLDSQWYLYIGILGLSLLIVVIYKFLKSNKGLE